VLRCSGVCGRVLAPSNLANPEDREAYLDYTSNRPPVMNVTVGPIVATLPPVERWVDVAVLRESDVDVALYE